MKVFVSYKPRHSQWAKSLVRQLESRGFEVWLAENELRPGSSWEEQIRQALKESDAVVLIISGNKPSPNVLFEMGMALAQGKRVVPIVIDPDTDISKLTDFAQLQSIRTNDAARAAEAIATFAYQ